MSRRRRRRSPPSPRGSRGRPARLGLGPSIQSLSPSCHFRARIQSFQVFAAPFRSDPSRLRTSSRPSLLSQDLDVKNKSSNTTLSPRNTKKGASALFRGRAGKWRQRLPVLLAEERFDRLNQTFNIDRELEFGIFRVPGMVEQVLLRLFLKQDDVLQFQHGA